MLCFLYVLVHCLIHCLLVVPAAGRSPVGNFTSQGFDICLRSCCAISSGENDSLRKYPQYFIISQGEIAVSTNLRKSSATMVQTNIFKSPGSRKSPVPGRSRGGAAEGVDPNRGGDRTLWTRGFSGEFPTDTRTPPLNKARHRLSQTLRNPESRCGDWL